MTSLLGGMVSDKTRQINKAIDDFLLALRRGCVAGLIFVPLRQFIPASLSYLTAVSVFSKVFGSYDISTKTAYILLMVIDSKEWNNAAHLIELIKEYGKRLTEAKPLGTCDHLIRSHCIYHISVDLFFLAIIGAHAMQKLTNVVICASLPFSPCKSSVVHFPS